MPPPQINATAHQTALGMLRKVRIEPDAWRVPVQDGNAARGLVSADFAKYLCLCAVPTCATRRFDYPSWSRSGFQCDYLGAPPCIPLPLDVDMVPVRNLHHGRLELVPLPLVAFQPGARGLRLFPCGDVTGCALHRDATVAFQNAVLGFCQRQAFLGCFFGALPFAAMATQPRHQRYLPHLPAPYANGKLLAFELGSAFGCHVVLTLLHCDHRAACPMVAAVGAHFDLDKAVRRSMVALRRHIVLLHRKVVVENDPRLTSLVQLDAYSDFLCKAVQNRPPGTAGTAGAQGANCPSFPGDPCSVCPAASGLASVLRRLFGISQRLWLYSAVCNVGGHDHVFCKLISPDFYLTANWRQRNLHHPFERFAQTAGVCATDCCPGFY